MPDVHLTTLGKMAIGETQHRVIAEKTGRKDYGDGASQMGDMEATEQFKRVLEQALQRYRSMMSATSMVSQRDLEEFERYNRSESQWELYAQSTGKGSTMEERMDVVRESIDRYIPEMESRLTRMEQKFTIDIRHAASKGWIGATSAENWMRRLKTDEVQHWKKEAFLTEKFPEYYKNWEKLGKSMDDIEKDVKQMHLTENDIEQLGMVKLEAFKDGHFEYRRNIVDTILAQIAVLKKLEKNPQARCKELYKKAEAKLRDAVGAGGLAPWKVGFWLRRIFESGADPHKIEAFLNGKGKEPMTLSELINRWTEVGREFVKIEQMRERIGTPRTFHFVHKNIFLDWHYDKRKAYVEEAGRRFADINRERPDFLSIRNALDMQDWDIAQREIKEARSKPMTVEDSQKLQSMEQYLRQHRSDRGKGQTKEERKPSDQEVVDETRHWLEQIPAEHRRSHVLSLQSARKFRAKRILWYNRVWCRRHHYLDDDKEKALQKSAEMQTPERMKHGHSKRGLEANSVTNPTNAHAAMREQERVNSPQILYTNRQSAGPLDEMLEAQKNNFYFTYWTTEIPVDLAYEKHEYINQNVHPHLQRLANEMENRGIRFTENGAVQHNKTTTLAQPEVDAKTAHEPHHAMAA
ncbi:hypothetical protein HY285_02020 [Candidatus Peregrinibacteria bacterium]|nr:hypothetical protein [Candidatus Peregrinibacteria bacterium]MBI3816303.1 hypothetical protein [Candidatus Peregrinibacteria bacterium]